LADNEFKLARADKVAYDKIFVELFRLLLLAASQLQGFNLVGDTQS